MTELKPCPLCGKPVHITEHRVEISDNITKYSAKIECLCGLTFEREWIEAKGCIHNEDIITAWNRRV